MPINFVPQSCFGNAQLLFGRLLQIGMGVNMQWLVPAQQVHGAEQALKAKVVIAMKMGDENMTDALKPDRSPTQFDLSAFTTIDHQSIVPVLNYLRGWRMHKGGRCRATTQYGQLKLHWMKGKIYMRKRKSRFLKPSALCKYDFSRRLENT
jgi:hypothetical protein